MLLSKLINAKEMFMLKLAPVVIFFIIFSGCQQQPLKAQPQSVSEKPLNLKPEAPATAYDTQLYNQDWQVTDLNHLVHALKEVDVIFIGEYHGNHASHLLQTQLLSLLFQQHPQLILSLEMFNRDHQDILNDYLDGFIGEQTLINDAPAWPNYKASYRPSVEFAKQHFLPVIAANASADIVRCIGSQGDQYITKLDKTEKQHIAQQPFAKIAGYKDKFNALMQGASHASDSRMRNTYLAQITRDNTMAESILKALKNHPGHKVIHLNGTFHSENQLGTVGALKRLDPKLNIKVISPLYFDELNNAIANNNRLDDFYYTVNPLPVEYVQSQNRQKAHKRMFENSRKKAKLCK